MTPGFEWDEAKAELNRRKHGIGFGEATAVFADPLALDVPDPDHSGSEERFLILGRTGRGRLVVVCWTARGDRIRIISARQPTGRERREYESGA